MVLADDQVIKYTFSSAFLFIYFVIGYYIYYEIKITTITELLLLFIPN